MKRPELAKLLLRIGLASVFLYASAAATISPNDWVGFIPPFLQTILPAATFLMIFSLFQVVLAVWLLIDRYTRYAAILTGLTIAGIMMVNLGSLDVTFRDIGLIFAAAALAVLS